jgi:hypothetical protein
VVTSRVNKKLQTRISKNENKTYHIQFLYDDTDVLFDNEEMTLDDMVKLYLEMQENNITNAASMLKEFIQTQDIHVKTHKKGSTT